MTKYLFYYDPKTGTPLLPMLWASLALTLSRVLEAVSDPLIGYWSDRSTSRWGRRRVFLFWGLPLTLVAFYFLWRPPFGAGENVFGNFLFLLVMTNVFFAAYTLYAIPFDAYLPEIARNEPDRVRGSRYKALFAVAGILIAVPLLGGADVKSSSFYFLILAGATLLLPFWGMRTPPSTNTSSSSPGKTGWRESARALFKDRKFLLFLAAVFFIEAACNMFLKYIDYFNLHVLSGVKHGILNAEWRHHLLYLCFILAMISGLPFWEWLSRKRNAFFALRIALFVLAFIFPISIGIGFLPAEGKILSLRDGTGFLYFAGIGFGYGGVTVFGVAILSFFAGTASESSGLYFGLYNFVKKIGFSIGIASFALFIEGFERFGHLESGFQSVGILMTLFLAAALLFVRKTGG